MTILLFIIISYLLWSFCLYLLFKKTEVKPTDGLIPGLNFVRICQLVGRKPGFALWLLFPIVNIFIYCGLMVDLVRSFNLMNLWHSTLAVVYSPAILWQAAKNGQIQYAGPILDRERAYKEKVKEAINSGNKYQLEKLKSNNPFKKSAGREWFESIVFAVFAAAFIRMFLIEAYQIPTPSMEGSLLVGDYLFVSKAHYGIRTPETVLMVPLLHNRIPILNRESYISKPSLKAKRLPALTTIKRNDAIVFNWPVGDSVYVTPQRSYTIGQIRRGEYRVPRGTPLTIRPMDKKDHYIKRCIGMPGDSLQIIDRQVYINGNPIENPSQMQLAYRVEAPNGLNYKKLDKAGVNLEYCRPDIGLYFLTVKQKELVQSMGNQVKISHWPQPPRPMFPYYDAKLGWSVDNYGPIYIPKKGDKIKLTADNIQAYKRLIQVYENNELEIRNGQVLINGQASNEYEIQQDYYWAMGDNRHNSEDSRAWGYVPHDHMVGKPLFIWFSTKNGSMANGIQWGRIFSGANKF